MSQVDFGNIKDQIKSVLDTANTTTASPIDLSSGLTKRVQKVLKVHPGKIGIQASFYPCVTMFVDQKTLQADTIARNQATAKRMAECDLKIVGMVWNPIMSSNLEDPADEDVEKLMENVEEVLRSSDNLNGAVMWQIPTAVTYHSSFDEQTHMRAGVLNLKVKVNY